MSNIIHIYIYINMDNKKKYGQFMTTNSSYILKDLKIPDNIDTIIEPFCGNGNLINNLKDKYKIECYDIEPKKDYIIKKDCLNDPPNYENKFIITNPPYLARNKSIDKNIFDKYNVNDLYKCFIISIINNNPLGGIIILPLNFFSSIRICDINIRKKFLNKFNVIKLNIYNEQVFDDTTYTICSFLFLLKNNDDINTDIYIYPENKHINVKFTEDNNYIIGGEIYNLKFSNKYKITRLTSKNEKYKNTNILLKCIDDNINNKIKLSFVDDKDVYIDKTERQSARTYASFIIEPVIDEIKQKKLVNDFNEYLNLYRDKYDSLFLTNYRESNNIARKRISFSLVFKITNYIVQKIIN